MLALKKTHNRKPKRRDRRAVATVELAICLPVLIILTLGTIDLCSMLFLRESVTIAAYEGARQGVGRGHTNADATTRVLEFLDQRNIQHQGAGSVQIDAPGFDGAETLENVRMTVTVPCAGNLLIPSKMFGDLMMSADVTMRKEYKNLPN
ncbi:TadE/TadG family type IV pilus assembly protein [Novipirellula artificiosorum]|uniref:TadE-like protein n=1 Tax=Novipirellula artificiosorum TaxID=2528016 RepID=A0A5C6DVX1_9BACT|nr:TadE family protein [Novipirellula artificiosorum]TWU40732.1 TadE-like protein [Novipirellula artificiosorum]